MAFRRPIRKAKLSPPPTLLWLCFMVSSEMPFESGSGSGLGSGLGLGLGLELGSISAWGLKQDLKGEQLPQRVLDVSVVFEQELPVLVLVRKVQHSELLQRKLQRNIFLFDHNDERQCHGTGLGLGLGERQRPWDRASIAIFHTASNSCDGTLW